MLAVALAAVAVVACSSIIGQALFVVAGRPRWSWCAPGVGFAALLVIGGALIRAPGHDKTVAVVIAVAVVGSLLLRPVRQALREGLPDTAIVTALGVFASLVPMLALGRAGILGEGMNNDSGAHLGTAWWLVHGTGPAPVGAVGGGALALVGYPVGPHGLIDALALGRVSLEHSYDGMLAALAPLTSLVALGALGGVRRPVRLIAALLVGVCYLGISFQLQASFKENIEGLLVLTTVVGARALLRDADLRPSWRDGIPLGIVAAGSVYAYSFGGLVWIIGAAVAVLLTSGRLRAGITAVPGYALAAIVFALPAAREVHRFLASPFNHESGDGNLVHALSPFELLGSWFNYDFRWTPDPLWPTAIFAAIALVAAVVAVARLIRAHDLALPAALIPVLGVYAYADDNRSIYLAAKAAAVAAPLVALVIAAGLLREWPQRRRLALGVLAGVTAAAAAFSSFLVIRDARVGPQVHRTELRQLAARMGPGAVLLMPKDDMGQWDLFGRAVGQARNFYAPIYVKPRPARPVDRIGFFDFDSFTPDELNRFRYAITTNTPYQSTPPGNWHAVAKTRSFILWKRRGRTRQQYATDLSTTPGMVFDCNSDFGHLRLGGAGSGYAVLLPQPVLGSPKQWHGQTTNAGDSASMTLQVPRGRWDLSLSYASVTGLKLDADGLHTQMPATIDRMGTYYLAGTIDQPRSGPLTIRARANDLNWFGKLIGTMGHTRGLDSPRNWPLGGVALTRHGAKPKRVQPRQACGRYTDHVVPPS